MQHIGVKATAKELQRTRSSTSKKLYSWSASGCFTGVLQLHGPPGARRRRLAGTASGGNFCPQNPFLSLVFPENKERMITATTITTIAVFLGPRGGRKRAAPADTVDTLRGRRKGDPQQKVVGNMY